MSCAIAAKIVGVSGSAQQRCGSLRRLLSTGVRGSTRELQDDGWHIDLRSCELVFLDDALLTICLAFDAVLRPAPRFGEQANDFEETPFGVFLMPIRQKPDRLANRKFVGCHRTSQHSMCDAAR